MCRNIRPLFNYDPPTTDAEVRDAALQFVRKISGFGEPSAVNSEAFNRAVDDITADVHKLLDALVTNAKPRNRAEEIEKARERSRERFGG